MAFISQNPATEEIIARFDELTDEQIEDKLSLAQAAFESWRDRPFAERAKLMRRAAEILRERKRRYGEIITQEMGRPIGGAVSEVEKCAIVCDYYAENAESILSPERVASDAGESYVRFDPLGIILAVMPWNYPFWQVFRFAAPALMAGNVGVLKHASNVPRSAAAIEEVFADAGFPEGAFLNLFAATSQVPAIIADPRIKAATLTGSEGAGAAVASQCGKEIKKTVLELGGSDPFIVLADADLELASSVAARARLQNAGQSCIAAKRFIVHKDVADAFLERFKAKLSAMIVGDPMDEKTQVGPLSTAKMLSDIESQVRRSVDMGAEAVIGGRRAMGKGFFYQPTILTGVAKGMPAYDEELFGPVASFIVVRSAEEAIVVANDSPYGLGASIWSRNTEKAEDIARRIEAGCVFVNGMVKSDPRLPFGGIKKSGYGRELSHYGIKEFVNIKTVWIA
jgi:succinate-semialdehyde dehydrogenase/glutarate-semialdehyde dehydrogenase